MSYKHPRIKALLLSDLLAEVETKTAHARRYCKSMDITGEDTLKGFDFRRRAHRELEKIATKIGEYLKSDGEDWLVGQEKQQTEKEK